MAGRGWSERAKALGIVAKASPRPGRTVPRSKKSPQVERREALPCALFPSGTCRGLLLCAFRRSASPHLRGGKLKAHLARRRENADAWLFEMRINLVFPDAMQRGALRGALLRRAGI